MAASTSPADTLTYTVTSPVSIPGGTPVRFELANIIHPLFVSTFPISITTKDTLGNTIDGPTAGSSSIVPIGNLAIANQAVTFSKISPGAVSVTVQQIRGATVDLPPNNWESAAVATCPPGSVATGGGFSANAGLQVVFSGLNSPSSTQWLVTAVNPTGSTLAFSPIVDCITVHP